MRTTALAFAALIACGSHPLQALAQSACSSDGQPQPRALVERFISADCEACWAAPAAPAALAPGPTALVVDWIVPTPRGDEAPLSTAATREALERLQALKRPAPTLAQGPTDTHITDIAPARASTAPALRVAHGPAVNDYIGTGMRFAPGALAGTPPYQFTLLMVEAIPAGTEGSPIARNVVRNGFQRLLDKRDKLSKKERSFWTETRTMRLPEGTQAARVRLLGWVQDARGRVVAAAQSVCPP